MGSSGDSGVMGLKRTTIHPIVHMLLLVTVMGASGLISGMATHDWAKSNPLIVGAHEAQHCKFAWDRGYDGPCAVTLFPGSAEGAWACRWHASSSLNLTHMTCSDIDATYAHLYEATGWAVVEANNNSVRGVASSDGNASADDEHRIIYHTTILIPTLLVGTLSALLVGFILLLVDRRQHR